MCTTQSDYTSSTEVDAVAERIGVDADRTAGKKEVCLSFQNLTKACSVSAFAVRSASFTEDGLSVLERAERDQVYRANSDWCTVDSLKKENSSMRVQGPDRTVIMKNTQFTCGMCDDVYVPADEAVHIAFSSML